MLMFVQGSQGFLVDLKLDFLSTFSFLSCLDLSLAASFFPFHVHSSCDMHWTPNHASLISVLANCCAKLSTKCGFWRFLGVVSEGLAGFLCHLVFIDIFSYQESEYFRAVWSFCYIVLSSDRFCIFPTILFLCLVENLSSLALRLFFIFFPFSIWQALRSRVAEIFFSSFFSFSLSFIS